MSSIPNDRVLNQLLIPGTHDSGTSDITPASHFSLSPDDPFPPWLEKISNVLPVSILRIISAGWSKTQPDSITDQLNGGVRYLDLRVCYSNAHLYVCHALLGDRFRVILQEIQQFSQANPSEIILLDINHVYNIKNAAEESQFIALVKSYSKNNAIPNSIHPTDTLKQIRQTQRHLIIFMEQPLQPVTDPALQDFISHDCWSENSISSPWPNAPTIPNLKNILNTEVLLRDQTLPADQNFFVLQIIQTEDTDEVIDGILDPTQYPTTIQGFELPLNALLPNWIDNYHSEYPQPILNIVMQDWLTPQNRLVPLAIQYDNTEIPRNPGELISNDKLAQLRHWLSIQKKPT